MPSTGKPYAGLCSDASGVVSKCSAPAEATGFFDCPRLRSIKTKMAAPITPTAPPTARQSIKSI